jgi:hypothetical protein
MKNELLNHHLTTIEALNEVIQNRCDNITATLPDLKPEEIDEILYKFNDIFATIQDFFIHVNKHFLENQ